MYQFGIIFNTYCLHIAELVLLNDSVLSGIFVSWVNRTFIWIQYNLAFSVTYWAQLGYTFLEYHSIGSDSTKCGYLIYLYLLIGLIYRQITHGSWMSGNGKEHELILC